MWKVRGEKSVCDVMMMIIRYEMRGDKMGSQSVAHIHT